MCWLCFKPFLQTPEPHNGSCSKCDIGLVIHRPVKHRCDVVSWFSKAVVVMHTEKVAMKEWCWSFGLLNPQILVSLCSYYLQAHQWCSSLRRGSLSFLSLELCLRTPPLFWQKQMFFLILTNRAQRALCTWKLWEENNFTHLENK